MTDSYCGEVKFRRLQLQDRRISYRDFSMNGMSKSFKVTHFMVIRKPIRYFVSLYSRLMLALANRPKGLKIWLPKVLQITILPTHCLLRSFATEPPRTSWPLYRLKVKSAGYIFASDSMDVSYLLSDFRGEIRNTPDWHSRVRNDGSRSSKVDDFSRMKGLMLIAVSYTHLTLPTILRV